MALTEVSPIRKDDLCGLLGKLSLIKIGSFSGNRVDAVVVGAEALKSYIIATVAPLAIQKRITSSFPFARGVIVLA